MNIIKEKLFNNNFKQILESLTNVYKRSNFLKFCFHEPSASTISPKLSTA